MKSQALSPFAPDNQTIACAAIWRALAETPEALAQDGLVFLQGSSTEPVHRLLSASTSSIEDARPRFHPRFIQCRYDPELVVLDNSEEPAWKPEWRRQAADKDY